MRVSFHEAAKRLIEGEVVAIPTETVYGLAASMTQETAIEQLFALKGRPRLNPLIVHLSEREAVHAYVSHLPPHFEGLVSTFWPGPLTCVLSAHSTIPSAIRAGLPTVAFRVPSLEMTRRLIAETGPLVMPSANLSGRPSATCATHVEEDFGASLPVLDGGTCQQGVESTILFYRNEEWVIARLGAIPPAAFIPVLGYQPKQLKPDRSSQPLCPGQLFKHYAPHAHLLLEEETIVGNVPCVVGFRERSYPPDKRVILLGSLSDPEEVAASLYRVLRQIDREGWEKAWVDLDFPVQGIWQTIRERLLRAAGQEDASAPY